VIRRQLIRWLIVGVLSNAVLYAIYLLLTAWWLIPAAAMTTVYVLGVLLGFLAHRRWSFEHKGSARPAMVRYVAAYLLGYLVNLGGLEAGVRILGIRHELVQAVMIVVVAALMFLLQKHYVFADARGQNAGHSRGRS
jgi:putative flippase GtrA